MRNDAEWFKSTFGDSDANNFEDVQQEQEKQQKSSSSSSIIENQIVVNEENAAEVDEYPSSDYEAFEILGYSKDEVTKLKDSIKEVILSRNTVRPRRGIPPEWCESGDGNFVGDSGSDNDKKSATKSSGDIGSENAEDGNKQFPKTSYYVEREIDARDVKGAIGRTPSRSYISDQKTEGIRDSYDDERRKRMRRFEDSRDTGRRQRDGGKGMRNMDDKDNRRSNTVMSDDSGEAFSWRGTPPTTVEMQNRIDSYEEDVMENDDLLSQPPNFFPDKEEFKDLLIEESKARIQVTGDWMKPLVQAEAKWRYNLYKSFLSFVGNDLGEGFDVESLTNGENGQSNQNRKQKIRRQEDNAKMYEEWIDDRISTPNGWTEITREDQHGDEYNTVARRIDKDSWFAEDEDVKGTDTNDDIEFAWDDQFVDEDDIRRDRKSTRATANSLKTLDQQMGRGRNRPSLSSTTSGKSAALRSYDLETDEY